jgi:hypothetical protein
MAAAEWDKLRSRKLFDFLTLLRHEFGVSKDVACAQIHNSKVFAELKRSEQDFVLTRLNRFGTENLTSRAVSEVV